MPRTSNQPSVLLRASDFCRSRRPKKCQVKVFLLSKAPTKRRRHARGVEYNDYSRIFIAPGFMVRHSLKQGDVVWLNLIGNNKNNIGIPVVIICSSDSDHRLQTSDDDDDTAIYVSPTIAASIGCFQNGCLAWLDPKRVEIRKAALILVRQIGRPLRKHSFFMDQRTEQNITNPVHLLQQSLNNKLLLSRSALISALDTKSNELFFFEVIDVEEDSTVKGGAKNDDNPCAFKTSFGTRWKLIETTDALERRLPCLSQSKHFHQSFLKQPGSKEEVFREGCGSVVGEHRHHPSLADMIHALTIPPHAALPQRVLHVVGTDENHVGLCVETAADQMGRRYLSVRGLAAFAHACGENISSGSLMDQMAGLRAAIRDAKASAPCVVHFHDFHFELNSSDEPLRHQQEQRFWTVIMESLNNNNAVETAVAPADKASSNRTHPVIVVISTEHSLSAGPLLQRLIHSSVKIRPPDEAYAKQLWGTAESGEIFPECILGRSAEEILQLKRNWGSKCKDVASDSPLDASLLLTSLCQEFDAQKTKISANIPNVHWEDVGGLGHVRQEIMDAIELPLRYRHLFPHSGRSGILLYGPPGTGKTLIAKAVATECGLPFLSVKGPELLGSYVGESEANVRGVFEKAREAATDVGGPGGASILFFDELDSLAPRRGGVGDGGGVMERVVATLSSELDGGRKGDDKDDTHHPVVFVIGATNRPDLLDPALLRPGRFDRLVYLGQPSEKDHRAQILAALIRNFKLENAKDPFDMALEVIDLLPESLTGADFSAIASDALMRSLHRLCDEVQADVERFHSESGLSNQEDGALHIDDVLNQWEEDRKVPTVTISDLVEAGKEVNPSVSGEELRKYESLRIQFSNS